ncbi:sensor histidine kinase [Nocardia sp. NPDC003963]
MSRWTSWWHELPASAKFRLYTGVTFQVAIAAVVVAMAITVRSPWAVAVVVVAGIAAVVAVEARADFAVSPRLASHRWAWIVSVAIPVVAWLVCAVVARVTDDATTDTRARLTGFYIAMLIVYSVLSLISNKWWILLALSVATGLAFGSSLTTTLGVALLTLGSGALVIVTTLLTVWGLRMVEEIERAKEIEAELQVAEERLRFARDLHDVVGRAFSAIAVKSELATALSRSGDSARAAGEMDEVRSLAVESMGQMRELVRGYRGIDLTSEVAGARSLLAAVDCRLIVEGDPAVVPQQFHQVAAWVVREGTTNIVEHSAATSATLALGGAGMSLYNDGPRGAPGQQSGLRGLAERLAAVGASLDVIATPDRFGLEIRWEKI